MPINDDIKMRHSAQHSDIVLKNSNIYRQKYCIILETNCKQKSVKKGIKFLVPEFHFWWNKQNVLLFFGNELDF